MSRKGSFRVDLGNGTTMTFFNIDRDSSVPKEPHAFEVCARVDSRTVNRGFGWSWPTGTGIAGFSISQNQGNRRKP